MTHPKEEKTVLVIKPDGVKRGLIGEIITRIEKRGLKMVQSLTDDFIHQIDESVSHKEKEIMTI